MPAKPLMVIRAPVGTRSGYGDMSRDIVRHLIELDKWDIKIISCNWGNTPMNALTAGVPMDDIIIQRVMAQPQLPRQPEIFVTITVPNEFQRVGLFNIGITAGIETTGCAPQWLEGMNRMDLILTISEHSKRVLSMTQYQVKDNNGNVQRPLKLEKPIEVLHNCVHTDIFHRTDSKDLEKNVSDMMIDVKEKFCFLFVGHWLNGALGADRKDVGMLLKVFLETFRQVPSANRPALILKTSSATFSVMDREAILARIAEVRATVKGQNLPSVYLLHGDLTEKEMNSLYNHPKVKVHVSFTKGEGFGRPLLEACMSGKPVIASGWSGQLDFLTPETAVLLGGKLELVHPSAVWDGVINKDTKWFQVDYQQAGSVLYTVWKNYAQFQNRSKDLVKLNAERFSYEAIKRRTDELMTKWLPVFTVPEQVELKLPALKKIKPKEVEPATQTSMAEPSNVSAPAQLSQVPQQVGIGG